MNEGLVQFGLDEDILCRQRKMMETLWIAFDKGKTLDDLNNLLQKRGIRHSDMTRQVCEIAWAMWLDRQELAVTLPVGKAIQIREDSLIS